MRKYVEQKAEFNCIQSPTKRQKFVTGFGSLGIDSSKRKENKTATTITATKNRTEFSSPCTDMAPANMRNEFRKFVGFSTRNLSSPN